MDGQRRVAAWCGRLLLFAALLLGIVGMHTLGHPTGHDAPSPAAGALAHPAGAADAARGTASGLGAVAGGSGSVTGDAPATHPWAGAPVRAAHAMTAVPGRAAHAVEAAAGSPVAAGTPSVRGDSRHGMDPMSVCLAVLGAALLLAVVRRSRLVPAVAKARAQLLRSGLWPVPPPPRHKALARLSVLRV
ncbi:hypothetical protein [Streptomyces sp. NPDC002537]